ncbi:DUF1835 domain-containing protein [Solibacillus sp. FSL K6-1781]|uniref:DUF1835 domain-containing protein n=1 Tax=Solibacillus isronensis B3W22 TaxID=1224748 RepID=K1L2D6_9BACL|nr:DUF1835 domain-containing protein [Solibacillus isronensis]AMO85184.1 hypothetical protein SOLI23_06175 [Solibacillus silvestris]EKB44758.1 hypothetical protein B857_02385 [Solibacillus isronensis B3W22]
MFNELNAVIDQLEGKERKALLMQIFLRMQVVEERNGYSEEQFFLDIKNTYNNLLEYKKNQANVEPVQYQATHIVFGDSPSGSLKFALKKLGLSHQERIITFSDLFSIGPIWNLHNLQGISNRSKWFRNHIIIDDEDLYHHEEHFKQTIVDLQQTPNDHPIIIWAGENAHEQTGLRFVLYLLKEKANDIHIIHTNEAYKTYFDRPDIDFTPLNMGELSSDQLMEIYENEKKGHLLTQAERKTLDDEWKQLCQTNDVLRIWENQKIKSVPENFYDAYIINTVKKLHQNKQNKDFIKSARIIGEVMGHLDQYIGDHFFEYRVRRLIVDGVFDLEGVPKAMRYYSIKIR